MHEQAVVELNKKNVYTVAKILMSTGKDFSTEKVVFINLCGFLLHDSQMSQMGCSVAWHIALGPYKSLGRFRHEAAKTYYDPHSKQHRR